MLRSALPFLFLATACSSGGGESKKQEKAAEGEIKLAGVWPDKFECKSILKEEDLQALIGAVKVAQTETAMAAPRGVANACEYQVTMPDVMERWSFDFDCRDNMKQTGDALFTEYARTSSENVERFAAAADAGIKPTDAGPIKAPEGSFPVEVGAKGLDHHGSAILFFDDDAPCYVRVNGPDPARRLEVARAIAKNLTYMNAPMSPRASK